MKKAILIIIVILLVTMSAGIIYFSFFHVNLEQYNFSHLVRSVASPNEQYRVDLVILGENEEQRDKQGYVQSNNNHTYDEYARLWYNPERQKDGSIMWYDKNTKIIYYEKDCTREQVEWIDNETIKINGITLNVHNDTYDYRRK